VVVDRADAQRERRDLVAAPGFHARLLDNVDAAVIVTDLDGIIHYVNRQAEALYGRTADEVVGHRAAAFVVEPLDEGLLREIGAQLAAGGTWEGDFSVRRADGTVALVHARDAGIYDPSGRLVGVASVTIDVTARRQAERRLAVQYAATSALASAATLAEAAPAVLAELAGATGWELGAVWQVDAASRRMRCVDVWHDPALAGERFATISRDFAFPMGVGLPGRVWATGRPVWIPDVSVEPGFARNPAATQLGLHGAMGVPIEVDGEVVGAVEFYGRVVREPEAELSALLTAVGTQIGQFIERRAAEDALFDAAARVAQVAQTLQASLLPPHLPELPGVEVAARYRAAGSGVEIGGDFYDLFETARDDYAVVIGDVCGKGTEAATLTALARHTLRAAAIRSRRPKAVLSMLNEALYAQLPDGFCTACYVRLRPKPGGLQLSVASGGHPLPFLLKPDGVVTVLGRPGSLIGPFAECELVEKRTLLQPGDTVVLYTDGVTEARSGERFFGEAGLRAALHDVAGLSAETVADHIEKAVSEFQGEEGRDDLALVVFRVVD
jgi:PAS domain S-box-containing protein